MKSLHWKIGNVEIYQIVELECGELIQSIISKATPDEIKKIEWLEPHFAQNGQLQALVEGFLVKSNGKNIIVDTANGNDKVRTDLPEWSGLQTNFLKRLHGAGVGEQEIDIVINTHFHCDHVGWNTKLESGKWVPTFPNAKYLFVKKEYQYWKTIPEGEIADDHASFQDSVIPAVEANHAEFVAPDHQVDSSIKLVPTPGHTPGHVCVMVKSKGKSALIAGDLFYHPCQIAQVDWTAESDGNPKLAVKSRRKILKQIANTDTLLMAQHFPNPVAGKIIKDQEKYKFEIEIPKDK